VPTSSHVALPSPATLERLLIGTLDLAARHVADLDELARYWADESDPFVSLADKIVIESTILVHISGELANGAVRAAVSRLAAAVATPARSPRNRALLMRFPQTAMSLGIAHTVLEASGFADRDFDALLIAALDSERADTSERLPYRELERRWLTSLRSGRAPICSDVLPLTICGRQPHPIDMLAADVYAMTHVVMFTTGFGKWPAPAHLNLATISAATEACLAWTLVTDNLDLMVELILTEVLLTNNWSARSEMCWRILEEVWSTTGSLPSPSFELARWERLEPDERRPYSFRHSYHTNFVAAMLCAVLLRTEPVVAPCAPVLDLAALASRCRRAANQAAGFAGASSGVKPCEDTTLIEPAAIEEDALLLDIVTLLERLADQDRGFGTSWRCLGDQARATPMLLDAALTAAARAYDLVGLASGLEQAAVHRVPATVTIAAASDFLLRQQLPSGAIGAWAAAGNHDSLAVRTVSGAFAPVLAQLANYFEYHALAPDAPAARQRALRSSTSRSPNVEST
jgi:hypothetical protein